MSLGSQTPGVFALRGGTGSGNGARRGAEALWGEAAARRGPRGRASLCAVTERGEAAPVHTPSCEREGLSFKTTKEIGEKVTR